MIQEAVSSEPSFVVAVMVTSPPEVAVTIPFSSTEALQWFDVSQETDLSEASSGSTVAVSFIISPIFRETVS